MINYGDKKKPNAFLHQAILSSPRHSMLAKIFNENLEKRKKEMGIDVNAAKNNDILGLDSPQSEKGKKGDGSPQRRKKIPTDAPSYLFTTKARVQKMENGTNKS